MHHCDLQNILTADIAADTRNDSTLNFRLLKLLFVKPAAPTPHLDPRTSRELKLILTKMKANNLHIVSMYTNIPLNPAFEFMVDIIRQKLSLNIEISLTLLSGALNTTFTDTRARFKNLVTAHLWAPRLLQRNGGLHGPLKANFHLLACNVTLISPHAELIHIWMTFS